MMAVLGEAQNSGDFSKMQEISESFQKTSMLLMEAFEDRIKELTAIPEELPMEKYYGDNRTDIDLDALVYNGDRDYVLEFQKDELIQEVLKNIKENNPVFQTRRHLLKSSLRLTPTLAPVLYEIGNHCKNVLRLKADIEFFVYQSDLFNASCYPPDTNKLYIILSSGIIERFEKDELTFVIGHEIGHVLFEHFDYPVKHLLEVGKNELAPIHAMKLYAWNRNAEISADRAGLLCCQSFEAAGRTFFKLSSGVTSDTLAFKLNEYVQQFVDLEQVLSSTEHDPADWYTTHPFSPLRIKSLELFNKSETYKIFNPQVKAEITEDEMEAEIKRIMSLMEPEDIDNTSQDNEKLQRFMFLGGYMISKADGTIDESETHALSSIVSKEIFSKCMLTISGQTDEEIIQELNQLAKELDVVLSVMQKLNLLRDLSIISFSDGEITDSEVKVLYNLARILYINTEFIDKVLGDAQKV